MLTREGFKHFIQSEIAKFDMQTCNADAPLFRERISLITCLDATATGVFNEQFNRFFFFWYTCG